MGRVQRQSVAGTTERYQSGRIVRPSEAGERPASTEDGRVGRHTKGDSRAPWFASPASTLVFSVLLAGFVTLVRLTATPPTVFIATPAVNTQSKTQLNTPAVSAVFHASGAAESATLDIRTNVATDNPVAPVPRGEVKAPLSSAPPSATLARRSPSSTPSPSTPPDVYVSVDRTSKAGISQLALGVTHMQYSLDSWGDPAAVSRGNVLLKGAARFQNQHIYGFGATNINPAPGVYDWSTLDERISLIRSMGATPVITLCCAPDWMTSLGTNSSTYPNLPPTPAHYADFANLARLVARRYPDVKYYQVWNEMKGFWDYSTDNWDVVAYTNLYNQVYDALKSVDPTIKVGGPYLVIEGTGASSGNWYSAKPITGRNLQVIDYWLQHKHGADFIALDRSVVDDHDPTPYSRAKLLALTSEWESIATQIRKKTNLPIWWSEDYFAGDANWNFQAAGLASMLYHELKGGSAVSLRWQPQGIAGGVYGGNDQNLFSDTRQKDGGKAFPSYDVYKIFYEDFSPGTQLYRATSSSPDVEVLASATRTLLINKRPVRTTVSVNGVRVSLAGYEVTVV